MAENHEYIFDRPIFSPGSGNVQADIHKFPEDTSIKTRAACGDGALFPGIFDCFDHVGRIPAHRKRDYQVTRLEYRLKLPDEYF
jgi:hypothetical protein